MKKQWVAEVIYLILVLTFSGICISNKNEQECDKLNSNVIQTTSMEVIPGLEMTSNEREETKAQPIRDTVPEVEVETISSATMEENEEKDIEQEEGSESLQETSEHFNSILDANIVKNENYVDYSNEKKAWWFRRNVDHKQSGSGEEFSIAKYSAYYLDSNAKEEDRIIYLTFDCGYENGFTPMILDKLAEKNVRVTFFVTKDFIEKNPAYVKRMKEEGHLVGNHTVRHLSSPDLTPEELEKELQEVARTMEKITGYEMDPFFRPPMGEYSERTLKTIQDMGYKTIFWSIAYYDYDINNQPGEMYVVNHFDTYHHNGAIVLMHNVSESNAEALDNVIDNLIMNGYRFASLTELR